MRRKITVFLIAAILCFTGIAAANSCWESCGTKVNEGDVDAVYALSFAFPGVPQFAFFDYNINGGTVGAFDDYDSGYLDMDGDGIIDPNIDVRITPWHNVPAGNPQFKYPANTKVANDLDQGLPLVVPQKQQVLYFIDLENDGRYDIEDPIYVDVNACGGTVEVHDIRLTANGWGYNAYTTVGVYDGDKGQTLTLMPNNQNNPALQGTFADLLGYIDDDCSTTWTCPDKLYLQQPKINDTTGAQGDFDINANFFVTIGDLRIYIPPAAIAEEGWPSCGTKVEEGDIDAVYTLSTLTNLAIGFHDFNDNGVFDGIDSAYVDIVNVPLLPGPGITGRVDNGDVRITPWHNVPEGNSDLKYPANTKVINDLDQGMPLIYPDQAGLITFFDINNAGNQPGYDITDPLYVDMDSNNITSIYDIRLTPREEYGYEAYTTVRAGDLDLYDPWPFWPIGGFTTTPANLTGYIDDDCSGTWTCPDKLYLEQPIYNITAGTLLGFDRFVTIGDMRLYIPPEAIANECWPSCGTKVEQCDIDAVYMLKNLGIENAALKFYDYDGDGIFDDRDTLYIDVDNSNDVIEAGDIRLTPWHNVPADDPDCKYPANTKVANDLDLNKPLIPLTANLSVAGLGYNVSYFDINGDRKLDIGDPFYIDIAPLGRVSLFDVRLTPTAGYGAYTSVRAGNLDLVENRALTWHPLGGAINRSIGYIDSDCSDTWTCVDKLYLNQQFPPLPVPITGLVGFATIGDMRLYIPPEEIVPNPDYHPYDENKNRIIDMPELMKAISDWKAGSLSMEELMKIIGYWKAGAI
ncbi:MAG: hypothetical protein PHW56_03465 [Methanosarcinaceae archaeon]|nr:hypothetical protein [Methanosarcinaceae archaeon]